MITTPPEYTVIEMSNKYIISAEAMMAYLEIDDNDSKTRDLLLGRIDAAVDAVSRYTQLSIGECTMSVFFRTLGGVRPVKYGPVQTEGMSLVTGGFDGVAVTTATPTPDQVYGCPRPRICGYYPSGVKLTYQAGYSARTIPPALAEAILVCASELYCELTGFKPAGNLKFNWRTLASPFRDMR